MPKKGWRSVSIPEEVWEKTKDVIEKGKLDIYHTPSDFIIDAVRRRLEELERIQLAGEEYGLDEEDVKAMAEMEHVNVAVNGNKTIIAIKDHQDGRIYDVILSQLGKRVNLFCMGDQSFNCIHVKYVHYIIVPKLKEYVDMYKNKKKGD